MTDQFNRVLNNEYRTRNFELWGFLNLLLFRGFYACYKTAKSIKRSSRSNILLSFDIHYSLFDIRYWNPHKK